MSNITTKSTGWNWLSFLLGPFWYLTNDLIGKGLVLLIISIVTFGFGIPFVWLYCGFRGNSDLYEKKMKNKSKIELKEF